MSAGDAVVLVMAGFQRSPFGWVYLTMASDADDHRHNPIGYTSVLENSTLQTDRYAVPGQSQPTSIEADRGRGTKPSQPTMVLGLIDDHRFSRECLMRVFEESQPECMTVAYDELESFIMDAPRSFDAVILYSHDPIAMQSSLMSDIMSVARASAGAPLVVFSDASDTHELRTIQTALRNGAQALISTRTTSVQLAVAALQFVRVGGVFAPIIPEADQEPKAVAEVAADTHPNRLTSKQSAVLAQMARGSANKVIAHELKMSESTVKIHVRNIMRKVGATNRTQAVYKAQQLENLAP